MDVCIEIQGHTLSNDICFFSKFPNIFSLKTVFFRKISVMPLHSVKFCLILKSIEKVVENKNAINNVFSVSIKFFFQK